MNVRPNQFSQVKLTEPRILELIVHLCDLVKSMPELVFIFMHAADILPLE